MERSNDTDALEAAIWAAAEGLATEDQLALLDGDPRASCRVVDDLFADTQARLESVRGLTGPERAQVIADFAEELEGLRRVRVRLEGEAPPPSSRRAPAEPEPREEGVSPPDLMVRR